MSNFREHIKELIHDLSEIPFSDALVDLVPEKTTHIRLTEIPSDTWEIELGDIPGNLLRFAQNQQKEADLNTLCIASHLLNWKNGQAEVSTPVLLVPVEWKVNKRKKVLELTALMDRQEINPVIKRMLSQYLEVDIPESLEADSVIEFLQLHQQKDFSISDVNYLGNFHYHRYHVLRELEGIVHSEEKSPTIAQLLGEESHATAPLSLTEKVLTFADVDQRKVFRTFENGNVVVQGPPGTGKSQVLTNLLGKLLKANQKTLVVSEKKVALDVLVQKLEKFNLDAFAFCIHSQTKSKELFRHLKKTWNLLESSVARENPSLMLSEQRIHQVQLLLDRLNAKDTIGGISYNEYLALLEETPVKTETKFSTTFPSVKEWLAFKKQVIELNNHLPDLSVLNGFKAQFFQFEHPDIVFSELASALSAIEDVADSMSWKDIRMAYESMGRCQLIENEWYKPYSRLLDKPREWKKVERNALRLSELEMLIDQQKLEDALWKTVPSISQIESWDKANGFFALRKRKKAIRKLLTDPSVDEEVALSNRKKGLELQTELLELQSFFREMELPSTSAQLETGMLFAKHLRAEDPGLMKDLLNWTPEKRRKLLAVSQKINGVYQSIVSYFDCSDEQNVRDLAQQKQNDLNAILPFWSLIKLLPKVFFKNRICSTWQENQAAILQSNWKRAEMLFPELTKFNGTNLSERLEQILADQQEEMKHFAVSLLADRKQKFDENEALLRKASQKCTSAEKERRILLKRGKAILVKEFGKTRSHLSIRELLESDASVWVSDLLPWWFATPTQIADQLPLKKNLFDVAVFDEASQIPLPNALGAIYRSKRVLIAGDEQQMSPTSYFGKQWKGNDLLHQASFYYTKVPLNHHYRSEHPDLIAFSNKHFYEGRLLVYPSKKREQALFSHFIETGKFTDRKNTAEADAVALFLKQIDWKKRIGIVAFSEEQLKAIWDQCDAVIREKIVSGQEENKVFFKTLEQVQGDEADILVVSMAYARNEENTFHLRFGPLNQANGFKRLNVLLTRAVHQLHFFHSVRSADFSVSANEGVNLLRRFLLDLESAETSSLVTFPHNLENKSTKKGELFFPDITYKISDAHELVTFHNVMTQRGWLINYSK